MQGNQPETLASDAHTQRVHPLSGYELIGLLHTANFIQF